MVEIAANDSKKPTHKRRLFVFYSTWSDAKE